MEKLKKIKVESFIVFCRQASTGLRNSIYDIQTNGLHASNASKFLLCFFFNLGKCVCASLNICMHAYPQAPQIPN